MPEPNAAVVRRIVTQVWNRGELDLADHLVAPTYVHHGGLIPDLIQGPEAIKISAALYRIAFPGLSITVDRLVADGDMVELRWTARARGALPQGADRGSQRATLTGTTHSRLCQGQIVESWTTWDRDGVLRRLAIVSEMGSGTGLDMSQDRYDG